MSTTNAAPRGATRADVAQLKALAETGWPHFPWDEEQLLVHQRVFPEGQLVIEREGQIVAAAMALQIQGGRDPYRDHTWAGATDAGWFRNHDPYGDTLYLAVLLVHPDFRGQGLGAQLCLALRALCARQNLRRILAPAHLSGFEQRQGELSPEEYASRVEAGDVQDPVLSFLLDQEFVFKKVLRHFDRERAQARFALCEWPNAGFRSRARKSEAIRVSCVQYRMRKLTDFDGFARQVRFFVDVAADYGADFVIFPELLTAQLMSFLEVNTALEAIRLLTGYTEQLDELFQELAREFQVSIVGGSHPIAYGERIENVASLYLPDGTVHRQPKLHVTPNEARHWGIAGGSTLQVFHTPKAKVGILICYDVEFPEAARYLTDQGAEVIFVPFCTDDRQAYLRVRYCAQARAVENQVYVAMAGTVGNLPDAQNMDINYAQSAVLSPSDFPFARDGILVEAPVNTETIVTTDIDFEALREAIHEGSVRPRLDRRPDLFRLETVFPRPAAQE
ncbi:MAG: bifunctional GNAT family N-acetyltransferase/carbon-nitrogen hydrolase family protein [Planctomycetota bacterium]